MKSNNDISEIFKKVAEHFKDANDSTRRMFSMLVNVALKFRDDLVAKTGKPLTGEEVRDALTAFMKVLKTHEIPKNLPKNVHDLVILWLEEVKVNLHH